MSEKKTTTLTVPRLGEGIVEVLILRLLKQPGDLVAKDELLYEMEHDKASLEIESPTAGRLTAWLVEEGRRVPIGGAVAEIEPVAETEAVAQTGAPAEPGAAVGGAGPAPALAPAQGASPAGPPGQPRTGTVRIPPRTRAHARRLGLDETVLATLLPARGRSLMPADLERHVADRASAPEPQPVRPRAQSEDPVEAPQPVAEAPLTGADHDFTDLPVSRRQKELNRALRSGTGDVVPAVVATEVREELLASALRARRAAGDGQSFTTAFQVFAHLAARVAADFPFLRSRRLGEEHLRVFDHVDLGIACAGEDGDLTIGVVRGSDLLDADRFDECYADAVERALGGESQADGRVTLMLSHLGDQGATFAVPVVVPPAAATLFLGAPSGSGPKAVRRIVLAFDHTVFNGQEAARFLDALRAELALAGEPEAPVPAATTDRTLADGQQAREVRQSALERLTALASEVADHAVNPDRPLGEQGIDSAKALRLTREAGRIFGTRLPATAIWKYPTLRALAELLPQTAPGETPPTPPTPTPVASAPVASLPVPVAVSNARGPAEKDVRGAVAVIGMACRVPGADDVDAFWSLLAEGHCRIEPVPAGRFAGSPAGGPAAAPRAGLLDWIDLFDARFFSVTPRQAASMDPQQRALLELSWHALEHAALDPDDLAGTPVGVFAAACSYDYREQLVERDAADGYATVGTFPAFLANRISHTYDFTGPSITVDTACSGALTALSLAERAIRSGDCEIALAGAANLLSNGFNNEAYRRAGMLSPQGTSLVFDRGADGFVRGEGAGWVVLKRLDRAIEDGDPVLAVLRATAVNHGGRAAALTAPNPRAQAALVRTALDRAGLHAADLGFLEAHGTATPLGDPIEIDAVREVLEGGAGGPVTRAAGPLDRLWVGSAKANIGHLEGASGLAGLIKAVHVLRNELIPGTPNFTELNPHIDLNGTPLRVADHPVRWPRVDGSPRRAAVSAFGFGGSNAHAVLEEAPALDGPGAANGNDVPLAIPLSAATARSLARLAGRLADRIGKEPSGLDLQQIAWSLQSGRRALAERMLIVTRDTGELADAARAFAAGETHPATATLESPDALAALTDERARTALLQWLSSGTADWAALWTGGQPPRRVPLVPYPFEREPYWLPGEPAARPVSAAAAPSGPVSAAAAPSGPVSAAAAPSGPVSAAAAPSGPVPAAAAPSRPASTAVVATDAGVTGGRTNALVLPAGHPLAEHRVAGRAVAPGALLIDALAGGGPVALSGVRFLRPVPFDDGLRLERGTDDGHGRTALTVNHAGHVHARAVADPGTPEPLAAGDRTLADGTPVDLAGVLHRAGIDVGTAYHAVTALVRSGSRAVGRLTPPAGDPLTRRVGWLDAALQAACALAAPGSTLMAAALGRVFWSGELPDRADLLLHLVEDSPEHLLVDLDAVTEDGRAVLRVRGLRLVQAPAAPASAAPAGAVQDSAPIRVLSPVWAEESTPRTALADTAIHTVALYDRHTERAAEGLRAGVATLLPVGPDGVDRDRLGTAVRDAAGSPLAVTLLVGGCRWTEDTAGVMALRHWLTALLTTAQVLAESGTPAEVRLLTTGLGAPDGDSPAPGASLQGALLGALRTLPLEVPTVTAAAVDLPADALHRDAFELIAAAVAEPCGRAVPLVALRGARRMRQVLAERPLPDARGFRPGGVYVVFGGAGGIGGEVARHLAARYRASLLLVGRSAEGEDVRNLLEDLRAAGGQAHYHRGDVTDAGDVAGALARCRTAFGEPDGLLHSVGSVSDGLLTGLTAAEIDHVLETKVTAVLTLRRALAGRPGTALVLFSSVAGLFGSVGGLNYAAANAFLDHYAAAVDGDGGMVVRTFDWGLWRGTGLARQYTAHVRRQYPGLTDFEPARGVAALEAGMSGTDPQTVAISGDPQPLRALTRPAADDPAHLLERYARGALARTMADLGLDHGTARAGCTAAADLLGVVPEHHRLLAAVLDLLEGEGPDARSAVHLAADRAALLADHPDLLGHVELLDRALASYGPVLRGEQPATAVLFPRGDLGAVSAIYSDNQLFDPVNAAVARELAADAARITGEGRRPRILEIGAGVGGTTASALAAMDALGVTDAEYAYTDVSRAFLQHARHRFGERVSPQLLDIEKSPAGQGFATGHYDLVVASNVLHATHDLTLVLRHVSELLAPGGRLLLVEITVPAAVYTLTFGLTDGWWRYVDTQYRLPHGPLLDGARWQARLEAGGWTLAGIGHLRDVPGCVALLDCRAPSAPAADVPAAAAAARTPAADGPDGTRDRLREIVRELLGDPQADIPGDRPWQELGIDSLLNLELVTAVSKAFGEISSTALFEHRTLDELARTLGERARPAGATDAATAFAPAAPNGEGAADLLAELTGLAADLTGQDRALIDQDSDFPGIGVDSLLNGEFTAALRQRFPARAIPSTVLFEHTSLRSLAAWLAAPTRQARPHTVTVEAAPPPAPVTVPATPAVSPDAAARSGAGLRPARRTVPAEPSGHRAPVAIVGLAGRYPGAEDVDAFWRLLCESRNPVTEVPADRWDWRTARTLGGGYARWGCFLDGWDRFDPERFRITPRDAAVMDPQERLFLEVSWEAFETAGYSRRTLSGSAGGPKVGVFAGVTSNSHLIAQHQARLAGADNPEYAVTAAASVANRVSHAFDLSGPSLTVDTMCSSSLTALHLACCAVQDGEADLALAGGVNLYLHPDRFAGLCALGMPSRGDRTRAFGAGGDGFVPGEGVGAVVLKRLDRAEADGDTVYAVIRGTGLNHGGGTGGYTVPNPLAQAAVIGATLDAAGIDPAAVGYLEAHGTGTELGDPIELRALALAFDGDRPVTAGLRIGSVKSNIGHGEAAAGIAGLTKAVLQLRHGQLVPTLHAEQLNPKLDLDGTSLHIQRRAEAWPQPVDAEGRTLPRLAAVSSFGAGGSNAHVLLEEYPQTAQPAPARSGAHRTPVVLPLSAPDPERLRTLAARLAGLIAHVPGSETLLAATATPTDIAHTLRVGRETWPHRAAVTTSDPRRLREALTALAEGRPHPDVATADTADHAEAVARAWVVDGRLPAQDLPGRRVALPTTPFARRRCTLSVPEGHDPRLGAPIDLPLADSVRIPTTRTVTARLGGASRWVADHVVDGTALLPGAFHPELVHEALLTAGESPYRQVIRDLMWPAPAAGLPMTVRAELAEPGADGARSFTVEAVTAADGERTAARGWTEAAVADRVQPSLRYRPEDLARHLAEGVDAEDFYRVFADHGFAYGPLYRTVRRALCDGEETTARLRLPDGEDRDGRQVLHPALFDGACQTAAFLLLCEDPAARRRYRPLSVNRLAVHAPVTGEAYVHARRVRAEEASGTHVFDVRLVDAGSGEVLAEAEGFRIRVEERDAPAAPARTADTATTAAAFAPADGDRAPAVATYRLGWPDAPRPAAGRPIGTLWTVGDGALADGLAPQAAARLSFDRACDVAALAETAGRTGAPATVLVDLTGGPRGLGFGADPLPAGQIAADWTDFRTGPIAQVFGLLQALVRSRALDGVLVLFATDDSVTGPSPFQRALHSLVRTVAGETGRLRLRMASVGSGTAGTVLPDAVAAVRAELSAEPADGEDWVRINPGDRRRRAALVPVRDTGTADPVGLLRADGTYLVIGGQGGLGSEIAAAVRAAQPAARLVLVGRSAPDEAALAELRGPAGTGPVDYRRCDVTDLAQLAQLAAELQRSGTELHGIVHTAGVLRDGFLRGKTPEVIEEVCRAKALAAVAVDAAFHDHPLDFFVVASSLAALVGNQGQSDYAFANGFLDGFAAARTRWTELGLRSGRSLSVGWPVLEGAGMAPEPAALGYLSDTFGLRPLPVREAVRRMWPLLDRATGPGQAHAALVAGDQDVWSRALGVVADGTARTPEAPEAPAASTPAVAAAADPAPATDGRTAALRWLAERVGRAIGVPAAMIAADRPLLDYGVDSIAVMRLSRLLEDDLGRLPVALLLDSSTLGELTDRLLRDHGAQLTAAVAVETGPAPAETPAAPAVSGAAPAAAADTEAVPLPDRLIGMWTSDQAAAPLAPYNISLSWRLADADRAALAGAVDDLVRRHPVLGCCVRPHRGEPSFVPAQTAPALVDRSPEVGTDLATAVRQEADRRFALATEPLLRAVLWRDGTDTVVQLTTHHLAADGRSAELIGQDLAALHAARTGGGTALAPAPSFADVLRREREDAARTRAADESFWAGRLARLTAGPLFPDTGTDAASAQREYGLGADLSALLSATARTAGVTPFTVLLAAFAASLGRLTGRRSFLLAVPAYGRVSASEDDAVGCFVNSVPLRIDLDPARPVADWLTSLHDEVRGAVGHAGLPYPRLAELCRAAGEHTVPTVTFAYQNWRRETAGAARGGRTDIGLPVHRRGQRGHFDLGLEVTDGPDGMDVLANHRTGALDGPAVDGLVEDLRRMVVELSRDLDGGRTGRLLDPAGSTLVSRFADSVRRAPDRTAVEDRDETLSYAALDELSDAVARQVSRATGPGEPVAVLMHRSARLAAVLLGILKSGRPYVPLDDSYPADRLRMVVEGAECRLAVADPDLAALLPATLRVLPAAQALDPAAAPEPDSGRGTAPLPGDLAYLMFTSGSTGRPKGVGVTHGNVVHTLEAIAATTGTGPQDRLLAVTTVCFDISVLELFMPLMTGGIVVVARRTDVVDAGRLAALIESRDVTVLQATPAGWQLLLDGGWRGREGLTALCGGEALPPNLATQLAARTGSLWNVYGPTEATIWSTIGRVDGAAVNLGGPIGATGLVVTEVDGTGAPAPGEPGELWVGGPGVAQGYWRRPELTAERFTAHPARPEGGGRWFRTGDLVRRDEQGRLVFLGRADSQVKIRGHRVELGEIEAVLGTHPGLARVVVVLRGTGTLVRLVAVAVPARGAAVPGLDELRAFAAASLPAWMLPDRLVITPELALTPNGKVDRKAAALLARPAAEREAATAPVRSADPAPVPVPMPPAAHAPAQADPAQIRQSVTSFWAELLELDRVPGDRRFFDLGGNSLLLGRLFARLEDRFSGTGLEVADLFARPTLDDQVALLAERLAPAAPPAPAALPTPDALPTPAAPAARTPLPAPARPSRREARRALRLGDDHR